MAILTPIFLALPKEIRLAKPGKHVKLYLPEGYRWIQEADCFVEFRCGNAVMDKYSLAEYYKWSMHDNCLVVVREQDGKPAGVVCIYVQDDHLLIDMVAREENQVKGFGATLVALVDSLIAPQLGKKEIRLEAKGAKLRDWYAKQGYHEYDNEYESAEWGLLFPMKKQLP